MDSWTIGVTGRTHSTRLERIRTAHRGGAEKFLSLRLGVFAGIFQVLLRPLHSDIKS